jgi:hypothetical protein
VRLRWYEGCFLGLPTSHGTKRLCRSGFPDAYRTPLTSCGYSIPKLISSSASCRLQTKRRLTQLSGPATRLRQSPPIIIYETCEVIQLPESSRKQHGVSRSNSLLHVERSDSQRLSLLQNHLDGCQTSSRMPSTRVMRANVDLYWIQCKPRLNEITEGLLSVFCHAVIMFFLVLKASNTPSLISNFTRAKKILLRGRFSTTRDTFIRDWTSIQS